MSKVIGLVAGHHTDVAEAIRAEILRKDPSAEVIIDSALPRHDAPTERIALGDKKIHFFNAVRRLEARGATAVGFCCGCPHGFLGELQTETTVQLSDPVGADGELLAPAESAARLLAFEGLRPKPFKVGLIGGLGPAATVDLYDKIVKATPATCDQEHIKVVVEQNPQVPDRTAALLSGGVDPTLALYNCARRLEDDGCDAIIIPCNTAHAFIPYLERHLSAPFINMQQATMDEIRAKFGDKARVGLMATTGTVRTGIYAEKARAMGIPMFVPDDERQKRVMDAIYGPKGAKAGFTDGVCRDDLVSAAEYLVREHDCNVLILGCTELPLILDEGDFECAGRKVFIIDPTSALARKVVRTAQESFKRTGVR